MQTLSPAGWYKQLMLKKILRFLSSALHLVLRLIQFGATLAGRTGSNIHIAGLQRYIELSTNGVQVQIDVRSQSWQPSSRTQLLLLRPPLTH